MADPAGADPLEGDPRLPEYFGEAWRAVAGFARLLRSDGVLRGLIGPNELGRLWERHLLNSAAAVARFPASGTFVDLGSGAGLPGVVLAAMRPRATVVLVEPMARRTEWLSFVAGELGLANVRVLRGRAQDMGRDLAADALTARAVTALDKLYAWAAPLVREGGELLAIKGARAADEVRVAQGAARRTGWGDATVAEVAALPGVDLTYLVRARRLETGRVR